MGLDIAALRASFSLVLTREPNLAARFYDELFARAPELRPMFNRRSRDKQEAMFANALMAIMDRLDDAPWVEDHLRALGDKHADFGVTEDMYRSFGDALVATLARSSGARWTRELEAAWREAYGQIASLMMGGGRGPT